MNSLGPMIGLGLTLDRNLLVVFLSANLCFSALTVLLFFGGRRLLDRLLITIGIFVLLSVISLVGLHLFARTPIRDLQVFLID